MQWVAVLVLCFAAANAAFERLDRPAQVPNLRQWREFMSLREPSSLRRESLQQGSKMQQLRELARYLQQNEEEQLGAKDLDLPRLVERHQQTEQLDEKENSIKEVFAKLLQKIMGEKEEKPVEREEKPVEREEKPVEREEKTEETEKKEEMNPMQKAVAELLQKELAEKKEGEQTEKRKDEEEDSGKKNEQKKETTDKNTEIAAAIAKFLKANSESKTEEKKEEAEKKEEKLTEKNHEEEDAEKKMGREVAEKKEEQTDENDLTAKIVQMLKENAQKKDEIEVAGNLAKMLESKKATSNDVDIAANIAKMLAANAGLQKKSPELGQRDPLQKKAEMASQISALRNYLRSEMGGRSQLETAQERRLGGIQRDRPQMDMRREQLLQELRDRL